MRIGRSLPCRDKDRVLYLFGASVHIAVPIKQGGLERARKPNVRYSDLPSTTRHTSTGPPRIHILQHIRQVIDSRVTAAGLAHARLADPTVSTKVSCAPIIPRIHPFEKYGLLCFDLVWLKSTDMQFMCAPDNGFVRADHSFSCGFLYLLSS